MARKPRNETEAATHHVFSRGNRGWPIFIDDLDRETFLTGLAVTRKDREWELLSFCLMENHFHLLLRTSKPNLGDGMGAFLSGYARAFNDRHRHINHLFGERFGNTVVTDDEHLRAVARYVARNPVKAGLVDQPQDWPWASWPGRSSGRWRVADQLTDDRQLMEYFGGCYDIYAEFVQAA